MDTGDLKVGFQALIHIAQTAISGAFNHEAVQLGILFLVVRSIRFRFHGLRQSPNQPPQMLELFRCCIHDCSFRRQAFQCDTDIERFRNVRNIQARDKGAAARTDLDQPFCCELLDGVAHGSEADPQLAGNIVNGKALPGFKPIG
jgi:hypothetical protein